MNRNLPPIIFQALPKWDSDYASTSLTIAKGLSKKQPVFYIDHPFSFIDKFLKNKDKKVALRTKNEVFKPFNDYPNFHVINPPFILPFNSLKEGYLFKSLRKSYQKTLWRRIDKILNQFEYSKFIYVNSFDPVLSDIYSIHECIKRIYHCVDFIGGEPYIAKHGLTYEPIACKNSDCVITTSEGLKNRLLAFNTNTICIENAADIQLFSKEQTKPIEYDTLTGYSKSIIYTGNIGLRIDYQLIEQVASLLSDFAFIFVGPKDGLYFKGQNLEKMKNVFFWGAKPLEDLPAYVQHATIAMIPFEINELTKNIYPLKLNEYLATGTPVISSEFMDFKNFGDSISTYSSVESFVNQVHHLIENDTFDKKVMRLNIASQNSWENRIEQWQTIIQN